MNLRTLSDFNRTSRHILIACMTNREGQEIGLNTVMALLLHKVNKMIKMEVKPPAVPKTKPLFLPQP